MHWRINWRRSLIALLLISILACNSIAWMQALAMTHFSSGGQRTATIEAMTPIEKVWTALTGVNVPRPLNTRSPEDVGLKYEVTTISFDNGETLEAWYVPAERPRGTIISFSAYAESKESELAQLAAFHEMGFAVLMVDFRGTGGSSGAETSLGVREAKDVARAVDYAHNEWPESRIVLYGVSMGSAAVLRALAVEGVKPDAVIIESPFNRLIDTVRNRFDAIGFPSFPSAELVVFWGGVQQGFDGFAHNPEEYAASVQAPTLLLYGERDPRVTAAPVRRVYDKLGGRKEFVTFPDAGHISLITASPEVWNEKVKRFLDREVQP